MMDSQDSQKQAWHKPEMSSLAGSASAGAPQVGTIEAGQGKEAARAEAALAGPGEAPVGPS